MLQPRGRDCDSERNASESPITVRCADHRRTFVPVCEAFLRRWQGARAAETSVIKRIGDKSHKIISAVMHGGSGTWCHMLWSLLF